jgi:hypothetical protein
MPGRRQDGLHRLGVEACVAGLLAQLTGSFARIDGGPLWTWLEKLLISHRRGKQPLVRSQFSTGEPAGKAGPVDAFLVLGRDRHHRLQAVDPAQYSSRQIGVHPYPLPFSSTERPFFSQL